MKLRKAKGLLGFIGPAMALVSAVSGLRTARGAKDRLALANAVASIAVAITGAALTVRALRKDGPK